MSNSKLSRRWTMWEVLPKLGFAYQVISGDGKGRRILVFEESNAVMKLLLHHYDKDQEKFTKGKADKHFAELFTSANKNIDLLQSMELDGYLAKCIDEIPWAAPDKGVHNYKGPKRLAGDVAYRLMIKLIQARETWVDEVTQVHFQSKMAHWGDTANAIDAFTGSVAGKAFQWNRHELMGVFCGGAARQIEEPGTYESESDDKKKDRASILKMGDDEDQVWALEHHSKYGILRINQIVKTKEYLTLYNLEYFEK